MKATGIAIYEFLATHPSSGLDADSCRREAEDLRAYQISSKRRLITMRSDFDGKVRNLRQQLTCGNWSRAAYDLLVAELRKKDLIDISTWKDMDAARMKRVLAKGEIRTAAEWRFSTEYRDTITDEDVREKLDEMVDLYEAQGGVPGEAPPTEILESRRRSAKPPPTPDIG